MCLTDIYTLYELDKHIGMTNVKLRSDFHYLIAKLEGPVLYIILFVFSLQFPVV